MTIKIIYRNLLVILLMFILSNCAHNSSPTGREQFLLIPSETINNQSEKIFNNLKANNKIYDNKELNTYIRNIFDRLISVNEGIKFSNWDIVVFEDDAIETTTLSGGKITLTTGLLKATASPSEVAFILANRIESTNAKHMNEILSSGYLYEFQNRSTKEVSKKQKDEQNQKLKKLKQTLDLEADTLGQKLAAKAGFNPKGGINFLERILTISIQNNGSSILVAERIINLKSNLKDNQSLFDSVENKPNMTHISISKI